MPPFTPSPVQSSAHTGTGTRRTLRRLTDATLLRCGGCGISVLLTQAEQHYGQLVHDFLGGHELCASAVEITRSSLATSGAAAA
jgi:hypothetical protein